MVKSKSPLVQKKIAARIAKKTVDEDHSWMPHTQIPQNTDNGKLAISYVKMADDQFGNNKHSVRKNDVHEKYNELDQAEQSKRDAVLRVRKNAERGPDFLQVIAFFGGITMVFTSILSFQERVSLGGGFSLDFAIISIYTWTFGVFTMGIEGRALMIEINSLHKIVSNYMKLFRFVWGRGLLYFFAGSLQYCLSATLSTISGVFMMILGCVMIILGLYFKVLLNRNLQAVPNGGAIQAKFDFFDDDKDGFITEEQFRDFVVDMNLHQYEDIDFDAEFRSTDTDNNGLINFPELMKWVDAMNYRKQSLLTIFETGTLYTA